MTSGEEAARRCRVFIVDHDADTLEMLKLIVHDVRGCDVDGALTCDACPDLLEKVKQSRPDLVLLDFVHQQRCPNWELLDELRADEGTSSIPVLAISTSEAVVEQALVSYNVRRIITKPFELQDLSRTVGEILGQAGVTLPAVSKRPGAEALREAAAVLVAEARPIVTKWLLATSDVEPFKTKLRLRPQQIVNELPLLLWSTVVALRTGEFNRLFEENGFFRSAAVAHAEIRKKQRVPLAALVREYKLLRDVIWQALREQAPVKGWTGEDAFRIGEVVHRALDEVVVIAVQAYWRFETREAA